jgi:FMN phosphatase YigB (HAD superfamily)
MGILDPVWFSLNLNGQFCLQIFDLALSRAGLADPAMALHVGDNLRLDYKAAKDCDWNALWLCKDPVLREQYPVDQKEVISDLNELSNHPILRV